MEYGFLEVNDGFRFNKKTGLESAAIFFWKL